MRLIDADQMAVDESEAYMAVQEQITHDDLKWLVNFAAHSKIQRLIADTPTVDAVPVVHGRWETNSDRPDSLICSICKCGFDMWKHDPHNYCPNCGAKMA